MNSSNLKLYPSYDILKSAIPPRSRLYHLEPIGIGTPYMESLTGYVTRLAEQHCVTTRRLLLNEIAPQISREAKFIDSETESISQILGTDRDRTASNGIGLMAANLVHAISVLTQRTDLHLLTLIPWAKVLTKRDLLNKKRAWCPACYQEWHDTNKSIYEPLLWCINVVQICPIHQHPLLNVCPHCSNQQLIITGDSQTGYCNKCAKWLGGYKYKSGRTSKINSEAEIAWQLRAALELGELITYSPTIEFPLNPNRISHTISTYINQVFQSNKAASRRLSINEITIALWCKGKVIPQIDKLLLLSYHMQIKLLDFLTKDILNFDHITCSLPTIQNHKQRKVYTRMNLERKQVLNIVLNEILNEETPPSLEDVALRLKYRPLVLQYHFPQVCEAIKIRHADYKKTSQQQKIQLVLTAALQEYPPPSLLETARRLGYKNNAYLYRYFGELSRSISFRYKEYSIANGQEKRERIRQEIFNIAQLLHSQGQKPSRSRIAKLLKKPGVMLSQYARSCVHEILHILGYE